MTDFDLRNVVVMTMVSSSNMNVSTAMPVTKPVVISE